MNEHIVYLIISVKQEDVERLNKDMKLPWILEKAHQSIKFVGGYKRVFFSLPEGQFDLAKHLLEHLNVEYDSTF